MQGSDIAKTGTRTLASALLLLFPPASTSAKPVQDHSWFCIPQGAQWSIQRYAPLVDTHHGSHFVQAVYTASWLSRVRVRTYTDRYELLYEYKFTEDGTLLALHGYLERWGHWFAEADLFPNAEGSIPKPDVNYRKGQNGGIIVDPDDGADFVKIFTTAPVYRTIAEIPCAVLFQEAEKRNATQE
jgi:hypothetical protein